MPLPCNALDAARRNRPVISPERFSLNRLTIGALLILILILGVTWTGALLAAGPPAGEPVLNPPGALQPAPAEQLEAKTAKRLKPPPTREQKRKVVVVTSIVIAGILTILLCMLLWIVWWSRRTHRLLRAPLPAANRGDELWYLKAKRPPSPTTDSPVPDSPPAHPQA